MKKSKLFLNLGVVLVAVIMAFAFTPKPVVAPHPTAAVWYQFNGSVSDDPYDFTKYSVYSPQPSGFPSCSGTTIVCGILIDPSVDVNSTTHKIINERPIHMSIQTALENNANSGSVRLKTN